MINKENRVVENLDTDIQEQSISWYDLLDKQMKLECGLMKDSVIESHLFWVLKEVYTKITNIRDYVWGYVDEMAGYFLDEEAYRLFIITNDGLVHRFYYTTGRLECSLRENELGEWEVIK